MNFLTDRKGRSEKKNAQPLRLQNFANMSGLPDVSAVNTNLYLTVMYTNPCSADLLGAKYNAVPSQLLWGLTF